MKTSKASDKPLISLVAAKTPACKRRELAGAGRHSGPPLHEISATKVQMRSKPHLNQVFFILTAGGQPNPPLLVFMLVLILIFAAAPENVYAQGLSDVQGNFAESEISMLVAKDIVSGDGGRFFPARPVTRAEFAKMLVITLGYGDDAGEVKNYSGVFSDINRHWAAGFITEAWELGIANGEGSRFFPDRSMNRAEMVTMLLRAFAVTVDSDTKRNLQVLERFGDRADMPSWAIPYVAYAVKAGIVKGTPEGRFEPLRTASRAEAAKVLAEIAAQNGFIYDYCGLLAATGKRQGEIDLNINDSAVSFNLSPEVVAYKGREKVKTEDLNGSKVFVIINDDKIAFIKYAGE